MYGPGRGWGAVMEAVGINKGPGLDLGPAVPNTTPCPQPWARLSFELPPSAFSVSFLYSYLLSSWPWASLATRGFSGAELPCTFPSPRVVS